ncbi:trypsin-like peptidase domain-containing protein [Shinella sp. S4-D37]|uniref:trypsin-like serine peptidase n=1 Tax=Shinella sp. S4-D37 TaxID=3161999 RepID=UPI003467CA9A
MARHDRLDVERLALRLGRRLARPGGSPLESLGDATQAADLSPAAIAERWGASRAFLLDFIRREMGDDPSLVALAEEALHNGREGLELIGGHREETGTELGGVEAGIEVIVRTDGSRPAFLIRDGRLVESSAPDSPWTELLGDVLREAAVETLIGSVGRVDVTHPFYPFAGTAWLIAPDLAATNRHVAQIFVDFFDDAGPKIRAGLDPHVDFGHEFKGQASVNRRPIVELVFAGAEAIPALGINHDLLDMAVLRLGARVTPGPPQTPLAIGTGPALTVPQTQVVVTGYPAKPRHDALGSVSETDRVLQRLFGKLWGFKRLAPGEIMPPRLTGRTLTHDASTLGGNSGSLVAGIDTLAAVTGLHYGGTWGGDRANWGHALETVLDEEGLAGLRHATLRDLAAHEDVRIVAAGG